MEFVRTPKGQAANHLFLRRPLVWVEGPSDIPFYDAFLRGRCYLQSAGGRQRCELLAQEVVENDAQHVVIVDGDYDVLTPRRSKHRRVVRLQRYGMENYLAEHSIFDRVLVKYSREQHQPGMVPEFQALEDAVGALSQHVAFDVARRTYGLPEGGLPERCDQVIGDQAAFVPNNDLLANWWRTHCRGVPEADIAVAHALIARFCATRRLIEVLPSHFLMGLLYRCLRVAITRTQGRRNAVRLDEESVVAFLCGAAWESPPPSAHHKSLRRRILEAVRALQSKRL